MSRASWSCTERSCANPVDTASRRKVETRLRMPVIMCRTAGRTTRRKRRSGVYSAALMLTTTAQPSAPVGTAERMTVLDAVRGVAVLGILVINVDALSGYAFTPSADHAGLPLAGADGVVWFLLSFLVE